jgi:hypothetical protein
MSQDINSEIDPGQPGTYEIRISEGRKNSTGSRDASPSFLEPRMTETSSGADWPAVRRRQLNPYEIRPHVEIRQWNRLCNAETAGISTERRR